MTQSIIKDVDLNEYSKHETYPDSGGRVIDNVITNTILPALSREILKRSLAREAIREAKVSAADGAFVYEVN